MRKRSERSLVLFAVFFVFACLLLSGGSRLIGHEERASVQIADVSGVAAAFSAAPSQRSETGVDPVHREASPREDKAEAPQGPAPCARVICDANGNVLGSVSYLRAVYQAFSLGDGFV